MDLKVSARRCNPETLCSNLVLFELVHKIHADATIYCEIPQLGIFGRVTEHSLNSPLPFRGAFSKINYCYLKRKSLKPINTIGSSLEEDQPHLHTHTVDPEDPT